MTPRGSDAVWFVTGASRGLGRALVERVIARGYRCVATARNAADVAPLVAANPSLARAVSLDVTDAAARERAVASAHEAFGAIDVLVNNAGFGYNAAVEEGEEKIVRALFDANFFAPAALIRAVLPGMRERGRGHIVNISSSGGVSGTLGGAYYSATKFALEGLSEGLAKEIEPLGLRVSLIEPGPFRTDFQGSSITVAATPNPAYAATAGARREQLRKTSGKQAGDPARAADAIIALYESPDPPLRLALGAIAYERIYEKLTGHLRSLEASKAATLAADFPPG